MGAQLKHAQPPGIFRRSSDLDLELLISAARCRKTTCGDRPEAGGIRSGVPAPLAQKPARKAPMNIRALILATSLAAPLGLAAPAIAAPAAPDSELHRTVQRLDRTLFDAFNGCDLKVMGDMVTEDLEFYHDRTGLERGRAAFVEAIRNNICGKVRREPILGTLEVYPLAGYGAVEIGSHRFCDARRFKVCDPQKSGDARFTMLWRKTDAGWKLSRVISYDHLDRPD
jgi:ketosteroid isomerase-like protein